MTLCESCGSELDDYAPCACVLHVADRPPRKRAPVGANGKPRGWGMRQMVEMKLGRKREAEK